MNENEERFAELCNNNEVVIERGVFSHKHIHKATRISPDHVIENQIDNFCINNKLMTSLQDVCVKRDQMLNQIINS